MAVTTYPGVYIEKFTPGAPIQGVGTSTAAFLGPASAGPLNEPTKITSWDLFKSTFGDLPVDGFYLWYAVRGFFENGGTVCYVTRVSNATFDSITVDDQSGGPQPTMLLTARTPGPSAPPISVAVDGDVHAVSAATAKVFRPTATITNASGTSVTVSNADEAARFRPGDVVTWTGSTETQPVVVSRAEGATIRVASPLEGTYNAGTVQLADLATGATVLRVEQADKLSAGGVIVLDQAASGGNPAATDTKVVKSVAVERISTALTTYRVTLRQGLSTGLVLDPAASDITVESEEFKITVTQGADTFPYDELGMDAEHARYFASVINGDPAGPIMAAAVSPPNTTPPPDNRPATLAATNLAGGTPDVPAALAASDYGNALELLRPIRDVNMVAIPDRTDLQVQGAVRDHCTSMHDRFAIVDSRQGAPLFGTDSVEIQAGGLEEDDGFVALYYPWLVVPAASGDGRVTVPPSGHVAGIYARTDMTRGVHKVPAGQEALVNGALAVERTMSDVEQGILNLEGIDVVRVFTSGGRPVVWGGRTTSKDTNWQYVNIRRLFLYIEGSIEEGIRWAVFEPNNLALWGKLKRTITEFLTRVWRDGGLFGAKAEDAFYVRIDKALNPFSEQQLGRLHIEVGLRPSYPAEFIIVRIGIWPGGSEISES
jgi:phage tail sheath protein FI